jgi:hypothetical protein
MVTNYRQDDSSPEHEVDARANELIHEFHAHFTELIEAHPEHTERKREIFEGWAIQKIAGLQLIVEHMAEQLNRLEQGK